MSQHIHHRTSVIPHTLKRYLTRHLTKRLPNYESTWRPINNDDDVDVAFSVFVPTEIFEHKHSSKKCDQTALIWSTANPNWCRIRYAGIEERWRRQTETKPAKNSATQLRLWNSANMPECAVGPTLYSNRCFTFRSVLLRSILKSDASTTDVTHDVTDECVVDSKEVFLYLAHARHHVLRRKAK